MRDKLKGAVSVLLSAFLFYLATFFVKLGAPEKTEDSILYLAARFWIGYVFMHLWFPVIKKSKISAMSVVNVKWLWYRAFWNFVAVTFFYLSVMFGSLTGANILNMTYPLFVAFLSIYLLGERPDFATWVGVLLSVLGAILVLLSAKSGLSASELINPAHAGSLFGILSGLTAAMAIVALRIIRLTDSTEAALFYNFRLGFWFTLPPVVYYLFVTDLNHRQSLLYPFLSGVTGILGQVFLTYGFKYVTAVFGSILSSARLIFAVLIGWIFFQSEINLYSISGALFIFLANLALVYKKK